MISIRIANQADNHLLALIGARMFADTFAVDNTPEDMSAYLAKSFSPEIQHKELLDPHTTFFIAEIATEPVGYVRLRSGKAPSCISGVKPIELIRCYADHRWIGKGIGAALMQKSLVFAREYGHDVIWLDVWQKNPRAIRFYEKWGFQIVGEQDFVVGSDTQHDYLMQRELKLPPSVYTSMALDTIRTL